MQPAIDEVNFLAELRDTEIESYKSTKVAELKMAARGRSIQFKNNLRKDALIELLVRTTCHSLSCATSTTHQKYRKRCMFKTATPKCEY